jgi:two-component system sensor histidine kinase PilS (NtrC family)
MPSSESKLSSKDPSTRPHDIHGLIFGRTAAMFLLLLASLWWSGSYAKQSTAFFPTSLFLFFLVSISLNCTYHLLAYFNKDHIRQRRIQFLIDVLLITWLVWETGDINSPYVSLYIVLICLSGFLLEKAYTLAITFFSAASFVTLSVLTSQEIIFSISGDIPISRSFQVAGLNTVAILFVGLMAARIAERKRIADELSESRENFADLNILKERIIESIDSGLITTDLDGKIYVFNRSAESLTGRSARDIIGKRLVEVCGEEISARYADCLGLAGVRQPFDEHFEAQLKAADNRYVWVACSISPLLRRSGDVTGLIVTLKDLSKVRELEHSLRRSDQLAAVGRMAAGLAHEIRNPLGSLSSSLQFLRERVAVNQSERSLFDVVLRESERLNSIITNFLSYARPPANALETKERGDTDIDAALRDCLVLLKHDPKVTDAHQFNYNSPVAPIRSSVSETQVKQVMWNLLKNSINAMPNGGDITVRLDQTDGGKVKMQFEDNGPGLSKANLDHLYEPFSAAAVGTGLGLSIVHKIVNDNGGRIDVGNANGVGTRIVVELPR